MMEMRYHLCSPVVATESPPMSAIIIPWQTQQMNKSSDLYVPRPIRTVTTLSVTGTCFKEAMGVWQAFSGVTVDILKDVASQGEITHPQRGAYSPLPQSQSYLHYRLALRKIPFPTQTRMALSC